MSIGIYNSLVCFFLFISIILPYTLSEKEKKCIKLEPAPVDSNWLKKKGKEGFHTIAHTNCERHKEKDKDEKDKDEKSKGKDKEEDDGLPKAKAGATRMCWEAQTVSKDKEKRNGAMICDYNSIETQYCILQVGKTGRSIKIVWSIIKTDNSTYFVRGACNFAKENLFFIHSTEPEMKENIKKEIMSDLEKLGYNTTNTAVEGESNFYVKKFRLLDDCPKPRDEKEATNKTESPGDIASKLTKLIG